MANELRVTLLASQYTLPKLDSKVNIEFAQAGN